MAITLFASISLHSQEPHVIFRSSQPVGGTQQLLEEFRSIRFLQEDQEYLNGKMVEIVFIIDELGVPVIDTIVGVTRERIVDSLIAKADELPLFEAAIYRGVYQPSLYFFRFSLEDPPLSLYYPAVPTLPMLFNRARNDDFEVLEAEERRFDMVVGFHGSAPFGSSGKYLKGGTGILMDFSFSGNNHWGGGLSVSVCFNKSKQHFPIQTSRDFMNRPETFFGGLSLHRWVPLSRGSNKLLQFQLDLSYVSQMVTEAFDENDKPDMIRGFSPGFGVRMPIRIGKDTPTTYMGSPVIFRNYINLHFTIRPAFMNLREAGGVFFELGVGYRMGLFPVKNFEFKESFLEDFQ